MRTTKRLTLALGLLVAFGFRAVAEDAFYQIPLSTLVKAGNLGESSSDSWRRNWQLRQVMEPYAVVDGEGEGYVSMAGSFMPWNPIEENLEQGSLWVRATKGADVSGRVFVPKRDMTGMVELPFKLTSRDAKPDAKAAFLKAREEHYRELQVRNLPGAAWFRHQAREAAKVLGNTNSSDDAVSLAVMRAGRPSELEDTYDLISAGRALSENLQLDRALPTTKAAEETVTLTNLTGITIKAINWKELIKDAKPELDPLASCIPADQHAVFFSTFQSLVQTIDEADANGTPVLQLLEPRAEDVNSRERYQQQLCLGLSEISRLLGPQIIASAAFTGSDPFLRVGTDLAVVFEARSPDALKIYVTGRQKAAQLANPAAKSVDGEIAGVKFTGVVSPDRTISSWLASVSNVVFVCNSRVQLETLIKVAQGGSPSLRSQDEYVYFRTRYPRSDKTETAFAVLSDATIRRWCGPKWRIADSRRTRAGALLAELQAAHLEEIASGKQMDSVVSTEFKVPDAGELRLTKSGVRSSTYGSLNFMTPIAELPITRVTKAEADGYQRWRENYQRNWRQVFDPIAVRFAISSNRVAADLTVMPLILSSDYRQLIDFTSGAQIAPGAGDPHSNALAHVVFAVNPQSRAVQFAGSFVGNMAPGLRSNPLSWLGQSIAVYADEDPFWDGLLQATNTDKFMEAHYPKVPVALYVEVKNPLGLAAFLTAVHAFVDQSAPRLTTWQNLEHESQPYVKISAKTSEVNEAVKEFAVYYASTPRSLIVTLSEPLLKRALSRQATASNSVAKPSGDSWLGRSISVAASRKCVDVLQTLTRDTYQTHLQVLAWNNLPILNEWKRLFPAQDPVKMHEQLWGTKLVCPGGGTYVWNEKWHTMESTVFGHPGQPKASPNQALLRITDGQFGITFENDGLSARAALNRDASPVRTTSGQ